MPGRDDEKLDDLAADFFGDELDWLDEDDSQEHPKVPGPAASKPVDGPPAGTKGQPSPEERPAASPSAPPPPPPFDAAQAGPSVIPRDQAEAAWAKQRGQAPAGDATFSSQKTLVFSDIPTLPPLDDEEEKTEIGGIPEDETPTTSVDRNVRLAALDALDAGASDFGDFDDEPGETDDGVEASLTSAPRVHPQSDYDLLADISEADEEPTAQLDDAERDTLIAAQEPLSPDDESDGGDAGVFDDASEEVPLVRTQDPAPVRVVMPTDGVQALHFTPAVEPRQALPAFRADAAQEWNDLAAALLVESGVAGPADRGAYLFRAGWVTQHQLREPADAEKLYADAAEAGCGIPLLHRERSDLALADGRWPQATASLERLGGLSTGVPAAEAYREAALVHATKLDDAAAAVEVLERARAANPDDYAVLRLLEQYLPKPDPRRADVHRALAGLTTGLIAAEHLYEAARSLPEDDPDVDAVLGEALAVEGRHGPAFVLLERRLHAANDHLTLAELYAAEVRNGDPDVDAGWWWTMSARHRLLAGEVEKGRALLEQAAAAGWPGASTEHIARLAGTGSWTAVAQALEAEAERATPERAAWLWYRLGWLCEARLQDSPAAVRAYERCLAADPAAGPATEGILRCLGHQDDKGPLMARLDDAIANGARHLTLKLAEAAEDAGAWDRARVAYATLIAADEPAAAVARAGLGRMLAALGDWPALSELLEARAELTQTPSLRAHLLYAAATVGSAPPENAERALVLYEQALDQVPDHLGVIDAITPLLASRGRWGELAALHRRAADATADAELKTLLLYRSARLHGRVGDIDAAQSSLEALLAIEPGFLPAQALSRDLAARGGDRTSLRAYHLAQGELVPGGPPSAVWNRFAASVIGGIETPEGLGDLRAILNVNHEHPGAREALEVACEVAGDLPGLEALLRSGSSGTPTLETARGVLRLAEVLWRDGRPEASAAALMDLASMDVAGRPLQPAVRLARRAGADDAAAALLKQIPAVWARLERVALAATRRRDLPQTETELRQLVAEATDEIPAHLAAMLGAAGEQPSMIELGQRALTNVASSAAVRLANMLWVADRAERNGDLASALEGYQRALELEPTSSTAAFGVVRCALEKRPDVLDTLVDVEALDPILLGVLLERAGRGPRAVEVLSRAAATDPKLPGVLHLGRLLEALGRWDEAHATLLQRLALSRDEGQLQDAEARRQWMLAEKLSHTDEAWQLYQELHRQHPEDRDVTETLARIAGARGETQQAIGYLDELAGQVQDVHEAARYKRRVAEAHLAAGDPAQARKALLDALDFVPGDVDALAGLKQLAESSEDWPALVQVLQREAGLAPEGKRLEILRSIARLTEARLENPSLALDAWRAVLDEHASDIEALNQTLDIAEATADWQLFVEIGNVLAALSRGASRTTLLRRIGEVSADHLNREDAVRYFERAIQEEPPDLEAARRLEDIYRRRSDAQAVARTLDIQGRVGTTVEERVDALLRAAQHELTTRHDRDAAAVFYSRALEHQPDNEAALRFMARHLFESGRFDEALPICERLAPMVENDQDLDDFDIRMELAQFYYYYAEMLRLADHEVRSIGQYERALQLNPTYIASLEAVGPLYKATAQWKKALGVFRQLLQLSGGQGERHKVAGTYTNLGLVERALGNAEQAKKRFNKALEIDPNHVEALKGMALLLEDREDWSNLLNIYNNIIYHATIAEDVIDAYMTKGRVLDDHMSRPDKAAQHYQRSLDFKADQPGALLRLAELAMRRDAYQEAGELAAKGTKLAAYESAKVRALLLMCEAAARKDARRDDEAVTLMASAIQTGGCKDMPNGLLGDLEALRQYIKDQLPR